MILQYAKTKKQRLPLYKDLLKVTQKTIGYAINAEALLGALCPTNIVLFELLSEIKHYGDLARQVYDQTYRRVVQGESVPADQKVVSIFEEHTDIIIKDRRDTHYRRLLPPICLRWQERNWQQFKSLFLSVTDKIQCIGAPEK